MQQFTDSFEYAQARKNAAKAREHRRLKTMILDGELGHKTDDDEREWARYYRLSRELGKKQELF